MLTQKTIDKISEFNNVAEVVEYMKCLLTSEPTFKTHKPYQGDNGDWYVIPIALFDSEISHYEQSSDDTKRTIEKSWEKLDCFDRFYT